jgi:cobalt/nickel transport system permease protein
MLAMHMANELLSVPVAAATLLLAAGALAAAARRAGRTIEPERLPLMGVLGAFIFAAQMINFSLPGMPGTSGHLSGGVLLGILLGPAAAVLTMAAILTIQCLLFQDGGLLALGCNLINMGIVPAVLGWGAYRLAGSVARFAGRGRYLAVWLACIVGVTAGAALVPLEAYLSGVLRIRLIDFLGVMVSVHLLIGFFEGAVTFAVLAYLARVRPALVPMPGGEASAPRLSRKAVAASLLGTAVLLAGVISWFASTQPDGLDWSYLVRRYGSTEQATGNPSGAAAAVDAWQGRWAPLAGYGKRSAPLGALPGPSRQPPPDAWCNVDGWTSLAGIIGTIVTLVLLYLVSAAFRRRARRGRPARLPQ